MNQLAAFINSLNTSNWIAIIALIFSVISVLIAAANYFAGRRERKLKTFEATPEVKATINRECYEDGWRSVQLHLVPPAEQPKFRYDDWQIKRARLLRPLFGTVLARAQD